MNFFQFLENTLVLPTEYNVIDNNILESNKNIITIPLQVEPTNKINENYIFQYLNCVEGLLIKRLYENNNILDKHHRHKLANLIIHKEFELFGNETNFKITTEDYCII